MTTITVHAVKWNAFAGTFNAFRYVRGVEEFWFAFSCDGKVGDVAGGDPSAEVVAAAVALAVA